MANQGMVSMLRSLMGPLGARGQRRAACDLERGKDNRRGADRRAEASAMAGWLLRILCVRDWDMER